MITSSSMRSIFIFNDNLMQAAPLAVAYSLTVLAKTVNPEERENYFFVIKMDAHFHHCLWK